MLPTTQSNSKLKPSTSSNRSKLSLRRKKGKVYDNGISSSSPNKTRQTGNDEFIDSQKTGTKQETVHGTGPVEVSPHLPQTITGVEMIDKTKGVKGKQFSLVLDKVTVHLCSDPIPAEKQCSIQVQTEDEMINVETVRHSPTTQNSSTHSDLTHSKDTSMPLSTITQTDLEPSNIEPSNIKTVQLENLPIIEFENYVTCRICKKDVSSLSPYHRQEHIDKCNEQLVEVEGHVSTGGVCLICKKQIKSEKAKVAHMKQCAKKNGVSTTKLLELVRDPKSATILLSDEGSQRKLEDLLPKEGVGGGGEFHKLDDLQLAVKGEDDDFKEPFPRLPPKLGRKRKKEDFQENYLQNLEEEQLQLALALSASVDPVGLSSTYTGQLDGIPTGNEESKLPGRKRPKKAKKGETQAVPPLLTITAEQAQDLLARRAEEILKGTTAALLQDSDEIPCTPAFGNSELAHHVKLALSPKVKAGASLQTEQQLDDQVLFLSDKDDNCTNGVQSVSPPSDAASDTEIHQTLVVAGLDEDVLVNAENRERAERRCTEISDLECHVCPYQAKTVHSSSNGNLSPHPEQTNSLDLVTLGCDSSEKLLEKKPSNEKHTSLSSYFQHLDYPTLWQLSSHEQNDVGDFYVPALVSVFSPVKKQSEVWECETYEDGQVTSHTFGQPDTVNYKNSKLDQSVSKLSKSNDLIRSNALVGGGPKHCSDLLELVGSTMFSDVEISTKDGTVIPAHAVLLAARCPALKKILLCTTTRPISLDFTDYEDSVVLDFLRFVYTGALPLPTTPNDGEYSLAALAHKWSIEELQFPITHTTSVATVEEAALVTTNILDEVALVTPIHNMPADEPTVFHSDHGTSILEEANQPFIAVEEVGGKNKHSGKHQGEDCDAAVTVDDSDPSEHHVEFIKTDHDNLPIPDSFQDTSTSVVDSNQWKPESPELLHLSIENTPPPESDLLVDLPLSPPFAIDNSAHDNEALACSSNVSHAICLENTVSCSTIPDIILHGDTVSEESFREGTRATSCARSHVSVSSSESTAEVSGSPTELAPHSDEVDSGQLETSFPFVDSPPIYADFATPKSPLSVPAPSKSVLESTPSIQTLRTPRDLRSIAISSLEGGSGNIAYKTPMGGGGLQLESDDNITPMPNYRDMFTPLLKEKCWKFGVKPLPKRKMIAKLEEIYEYTHPLVDTNGVIVLPQQDPPKQKSSKGQGKKKADSAANTNQTADESSSTDLMTKIKGCISSNRELYQDILLFKPLELTVIQSKLKESGLIVSKDRLMDVLDQWCVTFTVPRRTDAQKQSSTQEC